MNCKYIVQNICQNKTYLSIYKSVLITSPTGFDTAFTNVDARQSWDKVVLTLFQRCFNVSRRRCINVVQRWKSDVGFCFIFNVGSTLFQRWSTTLKQRWSTTLKQRWSDVEMLAGYTPSTRLSICLPTRNTRLSTRSIGLSTRSAICRSFYNWSLVTLYFEKVSWRKKLYG